MIKSAGFRHAATVVAGTLALSLGALAAPGLAQAQSATPTGAATHAAAGLTTALRTTTAVPATNVSSLATPHATVNLGLDTAQAEGIQLWLTAFWGYRAEIDGQLGPQSWMAMQRFLKAKYGYSSSIDGVAGPLTVKALQRFLKQNYGYTSSIDGIAGPKTRAAFARWANALITPR